jgi:hypothetical protein
MAYIGRVPGLFFFLLTTNNMLIRLMKIKSASPGIHGKRPLDNYRFLSHGK